jgi:hypothetical protein
MWLPGQNRPISVDQTKRATHLLCKLARQWLRFDLVTEIEPIDPLA